MMRKLRPILTEPLFHFLILGAALFFVHAWLSRGTYDGSAESRVRVSRQEVQWLKDTWARQWQREPNRDELRGLVIDYLREELLSREARELRLDESDPVVRRRLAQKMEFVVQDVSKLSEPSESELQAYLTAHPAEFRDEERVSFAHVFFKRGHEAELGSALDRLSVNPDLDGLGDPFLIEPEIRDAAESVIASRFGADFATSVFAVEPGPWKGPIESAYGLHLVRVFDHRSSRLRDLAEVRERVVEAWRDERRREANEKYFAALLRKYHVSLDESVISWIGGLSEKEMAR